MPVNSASWIRVIFFWRRSPHSSNFMHFIIPKFFPLYAHLILFLFDYKYSEKFFPILILYYINKISGFLSKFFHFYLLSDIINYIYAPINLVHRERRKNEISL